MNDEADELGKAAPVPAAAPPLPTVAPADKIIGELCNNFRFFIDLRHKVFTLFAVGNAALLASFWTMRINLEARDVEAYRSAGMLIRLSGAIVCIVCFFIAHHVGQQATKYQLQILRTCEKSRCDPDVLPGSGLVQC